MTTIFLCLVSMFVTFVVVVKLAALKYEPSTCKRFKMRIVAEKMSVFTSESAVAVTQFKVQARYNWLPLWITCKVSGSKGQLTHSSTFTTLEEAENYVAWARGNDAEAEVKVVKEF